VLLAAVFFAFDDESFFSGFEPDDPDPEEVSDFSAFVSLLASPSDPAESPLDSEDSLLASPEPLRDLVEPRLSVL
jgi:hypothetical protein